MLRGWKEVFLFSLKQTVKSKTYIITLVTTFVLLMVLVPVMSNMGDSITGSTNIDKIIVVNQSDIDELDYDAIHNGTYEKYKDIKIIESDKTYEEEEQELEKESNRNNILINIERTESFYDVSVIKSDKSDVTASDLDMLAEVVYESVQESVYSSVTDNKDIIDMMNAEVIVNVYDEKDITESEEDDSDGLVGILYAFSFVVYMLIVMSGENIANMLVTEKSSKVVEFMRTSVNTKALLLGKALAGVVASSIQVVIMSVGFFISLLSGGDSESNPMVAMIKDMGLENYIDKITPVTIIFAVVILILSFLIYTLVSCFSASLVSRIEEVAEANKVYMMVTMISFFLVLYTAMGLFDFGDTFENALLIVPFTAIYISPVYALFAEIDIVMCLIIIAALVVSGIILMIFVAKVYDMLIAYNGNPITIKELIKMMKNNKTTRNSKMVKKVEGGDDNEQI